MRAQHHRARVLGAEALLHDPRPQAPQRAVLGDLLEEVDVRVEDPRQPRRERVDVDAALAHRLDVGDRVGEAEGDLLDRRRAGLAHVVAGQRDRVEARRVRRAPGDQVGGQPQRGLGRVDERAARDVLLEHVVLRGAGDLARAATPCLSATATYIATSTGAGALIVIEVETRSSGNAVEDGLHVGERVDRDADLADLAGRALVVGVEPHLGRQVEGGREAGLALGEQELEALVGRLGRAEAGVLADRPVAAAVHRRLDAARERVLAGEAEVALVVEVLRRARACRCGPSRARRGSRSPRGARRTSRARGPAGPPPSGAGRSRSSASSCSLERISSSSSALPLPGRCRCHCLPITLGHADASSEAHDVSLMGG